ncbi:MAG: phosphoribosylformylglycinamidine synthase subunit PurS [Bdellovibrionales bacterium]|nr:phosphoribosylformylglycinamidine synthase subunit PurS [Bdellovibrionales bacterium]
MKILVKILPKPEVLDSAGRATFNALKADFESLSGCHLGKLVELDFKEGVTEKKALEEAEKMANSLLINPLVEICEFEVKE